MDVRILPWPNLESALKAFGHIGIAQQRDGNDRPKHCVAISPRYDVGGIAGLDFYFSEGVIAKDRRMATFLEKFERACADWPEVVECDTVTGAVDYVLRVVTRDMHAYDDFLRDKMLALGVVSDVQSLIVMRAPKRTTAAPLELIAKD